MAGNGCIVDRANQSQIYLWCGKNYEYCTRVHPSSPLPVRPGLYALCVLYVHFSTPPQVVRQGMKIVGSSELLGNPMGLLLNMSAGVKVGNLKTVLTVPVRRRA